MKKLLALLGLTLLLLVACSSNTSETPTATEVVSTGAGTDAEQPAAVEPDVETAEAEAPGAAPLEEPAEGASTAPEEVTITAPDGFRLAGTFFPAVAEGARPGILLLHMLGSDREAWINTGLPRMLSDAGYNALVIDMRGHGDTGGDRDWELIAADLPSVLDYLAVREEVDGSQLALVGASIGANLALVIGAEEPEVETVVLLSPGLDYRGVTTEAALPAFAPRPLLIVASEEDSYAAGSSRALADRAGEAAELVMYQGAGHGTSMFAAEPELADRIVNWLAENF